jgi:HSP20 family protein
MVLQRWDPFRELQEMDNTMNRLWRGFGSRLTTQEGAEDWNISIDVVRKPEEIVVKASLPGIKPDDIDITVEDNLLTLKAQRSEEFQTGEDTAYLIRERTSGSYYRALRLPDTVDVDKINSNYEHGVLTITLPKMEEKKPKQIKVNVGGGAREIESTAKKK